MRRPAAGARAGWVPPCRSTCTTRSIASRAASSRATSPSTMSVTPATSPHSTQRTATTSQFALPPRRVCRRRPLRSTGCTPAGPDPGEGPAVAGVQQVRGRGRRPGSAAGRRRLGVSFDVEPVRGLFTVRRRARRRHGGLGDRRAAGQLADPPATSLTPSAVCRAHRSHHHGHPFSRLDRKHRRTRRALDPD